VHIITRYDRYVVAYGADATPNPAQMFQRRRLLQWQLHPLLSGTARRAVRACVLVCCTRHDVNSVVARWMTVRAPARRQWAARRRHRRPHKTPPPRRSTLDASLPALFHARTEVAGGKKIRRQPPTLQLLQAQIDPRLSVIIRHRRIPSSSGAHLTSHVLLANERTQPTCRLRVLLIHKGSNYVFCQHCTWKNTQST